MVENRIAVDAKGIKALPNLAEARARALTEAIVNSARHMHTLRHLPKGLGGVITEVQGAEPTRSALSDRVPSQVTVETWMLAKKGARGR